MSLPTPEEVARDLGDADCSHGRLHEYDRGTELWNATDCETCLAAAIRADRLRVLDACCEEVRLAFYSKGAHRSVGYFLGKLVVRLDDLRREIEQS